MNSKLRKGSLLMDIQTFSFMKNKIYVRQITLTPKQIRAEVSGGQWITQEYSHSLMLSNLSESKEGWIPNSIKKH